MDVSYAVGDEEHAQIDADVTFENFRNLFETMMSTIVLPDKWK